ncbi:MAG TPA: glucokinase [Steroidobacteraceae bacterium]
MSDEDMMLVGDIGGTHARFAAVDVSPSGPWRLLHRLDFAIDFPTFEEALRSYMQRSGLARVPPAATIAVAGPVTDGQARLTNRDWLISERHLRSFGCSKALLINDFVALAYSVDSLSADGLRILGPDLKGLDGAPITILGAGTGFGVSCLARYGALEVPIATEGGHIGFAPGDEAEIAVLHRLFGRFGRVSVERILSGPGLEALHQALEEIGGRAPPSLPAAQIVARAHGGDAGCTAALTMFCSVFGSVAGDFALAHGARGGVYIAGGIAQKIEDFLRRSPFRARFEDKGRLSPYVQAIPTTLLIDGDAALLGAARAGLVLQSAKLTDAAAAPRARR